MTKKSPPSPPVPKRDPPAEAAVEAVRERRSSANLRVGESVRQLSLAGFGAIWVLRGEIAANSTTLPPLLAAAAFFLVCALLGDLFHNVYTGWAATHRLRQFREGAPATIEGRLWLFLRSWHIGSLMFLGKIGLMIVAYLLILGEAARGLL